LGGTPGLTFLRQMRGLPHLRLKHLASEKTGQKETSFARSAVLLNELRGFAPGAVKAFPSLRYGFSAGVPNLPPLCSVQAG